MATRQESDEARFAKKYVKRESGCWEWIAGFIGKGYGRFSIAGVRTRIAHRLSYLLATGELPDGLNILHDCDNRKCVNPDHLYAGTQAQNVADMFQRGRCNYTRTHKPGYTPKPRNASAYTRGERHPKAKLTAGAVKNIRQLHDQGMTLRAIAAQHGVQHGHISKIVKGTMWKHVE